MKAFKKTLAALTAMLMLSGVLPTFSANAAVQDEPAAVTEDTGQQDTSNNSGTYDDHWVYTGSADKGAEAVGAGDSSSNEIEINVKAIKKAGGAKAAVPNATACLYIDADLKRKVTDEDGDGIIKMPVGDLTKEQLYKATVSAYKKVDEGRAIDGYDRDPVFSAFKKTKADGTEEIIRYEYELHSETVDDGGNWTGVEIATGTKADIVFAIDATGSMGGEITSVKNNIASFADTLIKSGLDIRFSIIEYRDITIGEPTKIHTFSGSKWTSKLADVTDALSGIRATGGGDDDETPIDALGAAASNAMGWRSDAQKCAFLFTDAGYKTNNNYGYASLSALASALKAKNICTSVITSGSFKSTYSILYTSTDGIYGNINSSFYDNMQSLANNILSVTKRKLELTLREPRIKYNLTVCYLANDEDSKKATYRTAIRNMLQTYAKNIAQATDGHAFINKVYLFPTYNRMDFFNTSANASRADIQIQTTESEINTAKDLIQIHSNAYPGGFYDARTVSSDASVNKYVDIFNNMLLDNPDLYRGKDSYQRIQMSAVEGAGWNNSITSSGFDYAKTLTHESGHYLFNFYDEYGFYENGTGDFLHWEEPGYHNKYGYRRPGETFFGLMHNQFKDIEISNSFTYSGLDCLTNKQWYNSTGQYWKHSTSCEGYLASLLTTGADLGVTSFKLGSYLASYDAVTTNTSRRASYPESGSINFVDETGKTTTASDEHASVGADVFDGMTESFDKISDTSYTVSGGKLTFTLTPQSGKSYAAYAMGMRDSGYSAIASTTKNGKLSFSYTLSKDTTAEIRLVEQGSTSRYVSYYIDTSPDVNNGYIYESVDGTTLAYENVSAKTYLIHISDNTKKTQSSYESVNSATYITAGTPAAINGGEIYSVASCADDIDYTSVSWFVYRGGKWTKLATDLTAEENKNIGARADTSGEGLYVLMAKKASTASVSAPSGLKFTPDKTADGRVTLTFTDKNTDSAYYRVYVSENPITATDADGVICYIFDAGEPSLVLNLEDVDKAYYVAVEIVSKTGARSPLAKLSVTGEAADRDGDGIPDWYCDKYLLWGDDGEEKDIANSDDDGDGLTNLEEYLGGSDPTNPNDPVATLPVPVNEITVSPAEKSLTIGESFDLTAAITPDDATNQLVVWSTDSESVVSLTPDGKTCKVTGVSAGTATVYAVSDDGGFSASCTVTVTEESAHVEAPEFSLSNVADGVKISWEKPAGAVRFRVYYYGRKGWTRLTETSETSFIDTVVSSNHSYTYTVRCVNSSGTAFTSDYLPGKSILYVAAPKLTLSNAEDGVRLKWNTVAGADKYRLYYYGRSGWTRLADTAGTSFIDTVVASGTAYTYTIRAMDASGKLLSHYYTDGFTITYITAPTFSLSNAEDGVRISWNKPAGAEKFRVYYYGRNGWTKLTETTETSFIDTVVSSGKSYTYTVRCINADGTAFTSDYRAGKKITFIAAPTFTLSNAPDGVRISWNRPAGAEKFRIFYYGKNGWRKMVDTPETSFVDTDVSSDHSYTYTVRCINGSGTAYTSDFRAGKAIRYIQAPNFSLSGTSEGVKISWNKPAGAVKFRVFYYGKNGWKKLTDTTETSFIDTEVTAGKSYTYTVRCINADGTAFTSDYRPGKTIRYGEALPPRR